MILIGTMFLGRVKEVGKQWVVTKFFVFGVPLAPISSLFVTSEKFKVKEGFTIPLNATSIMAAYLRSLSFISAFFFIFFGILRDNTTLLVVGISLVVIWIALLFFFGKATKEEIAERTKIGSATGLYAMPDWFSFEDAQMNFKNYERHYKENYGDSDWKADLKSSHIPEDKRPILYALALFNHIIDASAEQKELLNKANNIYE